MILEPGEYTPLEDARDRMAADPAIVEVAGALALAVQRHIPCVILVNEHDAPTWREYTHMHRDITIVPSALMAPGTARVKA